MENSMKNKFYGIAAAGLIVGASLPPAAALAASATVEAAKDACIVGEQTDGYLGVVAGADAGDAVRREIRDINQQRKAVYSDLAHRNGVTIEVTAALTAEKLINQASAGQCYRDESGAWVEV